jgi:hypothetical protein
MLPDCYQLFHFYDKDIYLMLPPTLVRMFNALR